MSDKLRGWATGKDGKRRELTEDEIEKILSQGEKDDALAQLQIPTERAAIDLIHRAHERLKRFGWREAKYCPKDGTAFEVIEAGSTGIFRCTYHGAWPDGYFMVQDGGDIYPTTFGVLMFRPLAAPRNPKIDANQNGT